MVIGISEIMAKLGQVENYACIFSEWPYIRFSSCRRRHVLGIVWSIGLKHTSATVCMPQLLNNVNEFEMCSIYVAVDHFNITLYLVFTVKHNNQYIIYYCVFQNANKLIIYIAMCSHYSWVVVTGKTTVKVIVILFIIHSLYWIY